MFQSLKFRLNATMTVILILFGAGIPNLSSRIVDETMTAMEIEASRENLGLLSRIVFNQRESLISWFRPIFQGETIGPLSQSPPNIKEWESRLVGPVNQTGVLFGVSRIFTFSKDGSLISNYSVSGAREFSNAREMLADELARVVIEDRIVVAFKSSDDGVPHSIVLMPLSQEDETIAIMSVVMELSPIAREFAQASTYESVLVFGKDRIASSARVEDSHHKTDRVYKLRQVKVPSGVFGKEAVLEISVDVTDLEMQLAKIRLYVLLAMGIVMLLAIPIITFVLTRLIAPLGKLVEIAGEISKGNYNIRIAEQSSTEISNLSRALNKMVENIDNANRIIVTKSGELERALCTVRSIFHGVEQGILVVDEDMQVIGEYSHYLERILEEKNVSGRSLSHLVFSHSNLSRDDCSKIKECISSIIGSDLLAFEANSHLLPREVEFDSRVEGSQIKNLEFEWIPLTDVQSVVTSIIVTIRDVTHVKRLKEAAYRDKREVEMIAQVLATTYNRFEIFVDSCNETIEQIKRWILGKTSHSMLLEMKRLLHTLKGNSRVLGLGYLTESIHDAEERLAKLEQGMIGEAMEPSIFRDDFIAKLQHVQMTLEEYFIIYAEKLQRVSRTFKPRSVERMRKVVEKCMGYLSMRPGFEKLKPRSLLCEVVSIENYTLESLADEFQCSSEQMAKRCSKPTPLIICEDHVNWVFDGSLMDALRDCLIHLISNSIVHGLHADTTEAGSINIRTSIGTHPSIIYWDNGQGIDILKVKEKGKISGVSSDNLSPNESLALVFLPGISTSQNLTELAGRGIGLDAARSIMRALGGDLVVVPRGEILPSGHMRVAFEISLPSHLILNFEVSEAS